MSRHPLAGLQPPPAPAELRARVLAACAEDAGRRHLLDRLWESRPARWAWLAAVVALVAVLGARNPAPVMPLSTIGGSSDRSLMSDLAADPRAESQAPSLAELSGRLLREL